MEKVKGSEYFPKALYIMMSLQSNLSTIFLTGKVSGLALFDNGVLKNTR